MSPKKELEIERLQLKYHIEYGRLEAEILKAHRELLSLPIPRS